MSVPTLAIPTSLVVASTSSSAVVVPKTLSQVLAAKKNHRHFQWSGAHITKANSTPLLNSWDYATPRRPANPEATVISAGDLKARLAAIRHDDDIAAMAEMEHDLSPIDHTNHMDDHSNTDTDATVPSPSSSPDTIHDDHGHHESDAEHHSPALSTATLSISLPISISGNIDSESTNSSMIGTRSRARVRSMPSARVTALTQPLQSGGTHVRVSSSLPSSTTVPTSSGSGTRTSFGSPSLLSVNDKSIDRSLMQSPLPFLPPRQLSNNFVTSNTNNGNIVAAAQTRSLSKTSSTASNGNTLSNMNMNVNVNGNGKVTYVTLPSLDQRYHSAVNGNGQYVYTSSPSTLQQSATNNNGSSNVSSQPPSKSRRSTGSSILSALQRWVR